MFAVVDQQQDLPVADVTAQCRDRGADGWLLNTDRGQHGVDHHRGIVHGRQVDEPHAIRRDGRRSTGDLDRQPRLPAPGRADQRHQPASGHQEADPVELGGPTYQRGEPRRQVHLASDAAAQCRLIVRSSQPIDVPRGLRRAGRSRLGHHGRLGHRGRLEDVDGRLEDVDGRRPGRYQGRVLLEDALVQLAQLLAGIEPQGVEQHLAGSVVGRQRLLDPPGLVETQHQLAPQALAIRQLADQCLQVPDGLIDSAGAQQCLDALLMQLPVQPLQAGDRGGGPFLVGDRLERAPPPQGEREVIAAQRTFGVAGSQQPVALLGQLRETQRVRVVGVRDQPVPQVVVHEIGRLRPAGPLRLHQLAQPPDVGLKRGERGIGRLIAPTPPRPVCRSRPGGSRSPAK